MKRNAYKFLIIVAVMAFGLAGCSAEAKVERQLELGASSMEAGDYDAAIEAYEEAIALDKYEIESYEGLIDAMSASGKSNEEIVGIVESVRTVVNELKTSEEGLSEDDKAVAESFFTKAVEAVVEDDDTELAIMEKGIESLGEDSALAGLYETKISELVEYYLVGNNFYNAGEYADRLVNTLPSSENAQTIADKVAEKKDAEQELVNIIIKAYDYIIGEDWDALAELSASQEFIPMIKKIGSNGQYVYMSDGGTEGHGIGCYAREPWTGIYVWYVGNYENGMRSGYGGWYVALKSNDGLGMELYEGDWENDAPNGSGYFYTAFNHETTRHMDVTVKDGLLSGTYVEEYTASTGKTYKGEYEMVEGKPVEIEAEDWIKERIGEDEYIYYVGYEDDITWWAKEGYDDPKQGLVHYRH
ncbi:MAG: tetratricopeptide repeat protein [Lachnospiraceae bacterium]|nr:tetratricopeptide repeat protein [Lachnospiraceae bacterium]